MGNKAKLSYLILGLGMGIIVTSTFYTISPKVQYVDLADEEVVERAKELGMVNLKDSINTKVEEDKPEEIPSIKETLTFEVKKGDNLEDIASNLLDLGIIDNKEEFILLAEDKGMDKAFIYGVYELKFNTSYTSLIKILTQEKLTKGGDQ